MAALSVAFTHTLHDVISRDGDPAGWLAAAQRFMPWHAGVDLFFVISGFVMIHASAPLFGQPGAALVFLRRRLARIVPLYWLATTLFLLTLGLARHEIHGDIGGPFYVAASYLFIPMARPDGVMQPAYGLGWTLNYEMFFYLCLTPLLFLRRQVAVAGLALGFCGLVVVGQIAGFDNQQFGYWANPIILEFVAGMLLALLWAGGLRLPGAVRIGLAVAGLAALHFSGAAAEWRVLAYGLPALALVAAAVLGRQTAEPNRAENWLVRLGDASYAMYLIHPFVIRSFTVLWHRFHAVNEMDSIIYLLCCLGAAQICALLVHKFIEPKLYAVFRR